MGATFVELGVYLGWIWGVFGWYLGCIWGVFGRYFGDILGGIWGVFGGVLGPKITPKIPLKNLIKTYRESL